MAANEMGKGAQALMVLAAAAIVAAAIKLAAAVVAPFLVAACIAIAVQPIFRWVHSSRIPDVSAVFPLADTREAFMAKSTEHIPGKVVLTP